MTIGKKLEKGQTIGIIGVSSSVSDLSTIDKGVQSLISLGYKVKLAPSIKNNHYNFPSDRETRAKELENAFLDPSIDAIMAMRGGFGAIHILDKIDYTIFQKNPKIFIGYSDLTTLQNALYKKAGLISFQGPMLTSNFAKDNHSSFCNDSLFGMISGEHKKIIDSFDILVRGNSPSIVEGTMIGGNLITFMTLMGTPYEPDFEDKILFFEDIGEQTYSIDRALSQLLLSDKLKTVKAFIFGDFSDCTRQNDTEQELYPLIRDRLESLNIPIISGIPAGHCIPMLTLPIGAKIKIDLDNTSLSLTQEVVQ